jgi:hypothetical protein
MGNEKPRRSGAKVGLTREECPQTGEGLRSRLLHTEHGRKLRHLFQLGPRLPLVPALFELLLAASSDPARLSVRWFSGLPGKCSAQNQRICSGPLRIS